MATKNITLGTDGLMNIVFGQQDENDVTAIVFDFEDWKDEFGSGDLSLSVQRPKDQWPYDVELTVSGTTATWNVSETDTAYAGLGHFQVSYVVSGVVKKSIVYKFTVYESLGAVGEVLTPQQVRTFVDEVEDKVEELEGMIDDALPTDTALTTAGKAADAKKVGDELSTLKEDLSESHIADDNNFLHYINAINDVYNDENSVDVKQHFAMIRGDAVTGTPESSTKRCYCKMMIQKPGEKIYFDDLNYKISPVFVRGENTIKPGWITSSPYTNGLSQAVDFALVTVADLDGNVVDLDNATNTTYLHKTLTHNIDVPTAYVSASGADTNDGSYASPFKTVNKALEKGATKICLFAGDYRQQIDASKSKTGIIEIVNISDTAKVYFRPSNITIASTETAVEGYTKVYQATTAFSPEANNNRIFQRNADDYDTEIQDSERLPQERGYKYRVPGCTIIKKCSSNTLADALSEIENSDEYKWYLDNGTIYFSRRASVTSSLPLVFSTGDYLFTNLSAKNTIKLTGIDTEFMGININNTINSVITDCSSRFVYGAGCFTYDNAHNAKFVRCEACSAFNGTIGDGFNAHGATGGSSIAHKTTAILIDCWSHDNNDDGFSDHECCESLIIGGLFEYNGKAGITPSYGSHCTCHGVYSRHNYNGFVYTGEVTVAEGGQKGQILCYNCVSESNTRGTGNHSGYQVESKNTMVLVGCKSINNAYGYFATSNTYITIIDCSSSGDTTVKAGGGTRNIITSTMVS